MSAYMSIYVKAVCRPGQVKYKLLFFNMLERICSDL